MMIAKYLTGILLLAGFYLQAQKPISKQAIKPLRIGDTIPDIKISGLLNYSKPVVNFSEFRGKFVLLDFWFGACPGCIDLFPKMEALQKKFSNRLQILMINFESEKQIEATMKKFRDKSPNYRKPMLPMVVDDTLFHQLFPVRYYPHEVWIDQQGVVRALTDGEQVNEENLTAMLENKPVRMETKADNFSFDEEVAVLPQMLNQGMKKPHYYSSLSGYIPDIRFGWFYKFIDSSANTIRITRYNMSILELFMDAYFPGETGGPAKSVLFDFGKRVVLKVRDSSRYIYLAHNNESSSEWRSKNCYTYETVLPLDQEFKLSQTMINDLEKYFNVTCTIERRRMKCMTLVQTSSFDPNKLQKQYPILKIVINDTSKLKFAAATTGQLLERISSVYKDTKYIFANGTDYPGVLSYEIDNSAMRDFAKLKKVLQEKYGLDLVEGERPVDVFVFKEQDF